MRRKHTLAAAVLAALVAAACSDDAPSAAPAPFAAAVEAASDPSHQSALKGQPVAVSPAVLVRDGDRKPMAGVAVSFVVTAGGGSVEFASATTDASGIASAGRWTLGPNAGPNTVEARVGSLPPVSFNATSTDPLPPPQPPAPAPPPTGSFDITVRYLGNPTLRQRQAVTSAIARWHQALVGDLPDIPVTAAAGACTTAQPALNEVVDDLLLLINFSSIDGPGKVLGQAGPCFVRSNSNLPVVGVMSLDSADLQLMESSGMLDDVILHELGHVLGVGTMWSTVGLLTGTGSADPQFTGAAALGAFRAMGGLTAGVPVENTGSTGTREGHWRESVFGNELMTGWVNHGVNPLSGMTIASLQDMGYGASLAAAGSYVFTGGGTAGALAAGADLHAREHILKPRYRVDKLGRKERLNPVP